LVLGKGIAIERRRAPRCGRVACQTREKEKGQSVENFEGPSAPKNAVGGREKGAVHPSRKRESVGVGFTEGTVFGPTHLGKTDDGKKIRTVLDREGFGNSSFKDLTGSPSKFS